MIRTLIAFDINYKTVLGHEEERKLLIDYTEIEPMPAVPCVRDWISVKLLPIPEACKFFRDRDWVVKYVEWSKDKAGHCVILHVEPE